MRLMYASRVAIPEYLGHTRRSASCRTLLSSKGYSSKDGISITYIRACDGKDVKVLRKPFLQVLAKHKERLYHTMNQNCTN